MNDMEQDIATLKRNVIWLETEIQHNKRVVFFATDKGVKKWVRDANKDLTTQLQVAKRQLKHLEKQISVYRF